MRIDRSGVWGLAALFLMGGLANCSSSERDHGTANAGVCSVGDTRECVGIAACRGGQVCAEDHQWKACDCGSAGASGAGGSSAGGANGSGGTVHTGGRGGGAGGASAVDAGRNAAAGDGSVDAPDASSDGSAPGNGGAGGSAGADAGGSVGAGGAPGPYTCSARADRDPTGALSEGAACCGTSENSLGTCVKATTLSATLSALYGHVGCGTGLECAPATAASSVTGVFEVCTANLDSNYGLEGRCLPRCFVSGDAHADLYSQNGCQSAALACTPCWNVFTGAATGACTLKPGDAPTTPAPTGPRACGAVNAGPALGRCIPSATVAADGDPMGSLYQQDECAPGDRCVPAAKVRDPSACLTHCHTTLGVLDSRYDAGACVPTYVIRDRTPGGVSVLEQDTCATGELCAPCLDPLNGSVPTLYCE
ncbi:MAG TPA: hypothetical protein VHE30_03770 [Polyangiaceae bacterium]|nr:hypothetical protein [Polyangiaceae bacterium]